MCAAFYFAIDQGMDVAELLRNFHDLTGLDTTKVVSPGASKLPIAYALTVALTGIPRTFLTVLATPLIARKLGWQPKKGPKP